MPVRMSDLAKERREIQYHTAHGPINVVYRPNVRTPADEARLASCKGDDVYREILQSLEKLIAEWDVVGPVYEQGTETVLVEEDVVVPVKKEILANLPSAVMNGIFRAVIEDSNPNSTAAASKNSGKLFHTGSLA
jgi:hypothetical protein